MLDLFRKKDQKKESIDTKTRSSEFSYLSEEDYYFDTACQSLRPKSVIDSEMEYYTKNNACGGRSTYKWAETVDQRIQDVRNSILGFLILSKKEYSTFFGLNTTSGINQILWGLNWDDYDQIVTSEIEHNSVFLPVMKIAQAKNKKRIILKRQENGELIYTKKDFVKSVLVVNTTSNIDGRELLNLRKIIKNIHSVGGIVILDACQTMAHNPHSLSELNYDAMLFAGHKMYGPSLGIGVIKTTLLEKINPLYIGGGTVSDTTRDHYELMEKDRIFEKIEPGLQDWAAIWAMKSVINFYRKVDWNYERNLAKKLHHGLKNLDVNLISNEESAVQTFYFEKIDSHLVGKLLSQKNIMVRVGYFCCHYYLKEASPKPPLVRISLGLHNTEKDIDFVLATLQQIQQLN